MDVRSTLKALAGASLPEPLLYRLRLLNAIAKARKATAAAGPFTPRPNPLPKPLLVSLTSFVPRFETLHLTLRSLLNQRVKPDSILLWIAEHELARLPRRVRDLEGRGVEIRGCADIGSYKKLIYALEQHPDCYIATADDDLFYGPDWLATLVDAVDAEQPVTPCHRAHRLVTRPDGRIAPYLEWQLDVQDEAARRPSQDILPTTGAGVLYPPRCFSPEVTDRALFQMLSPTADDLWFYWMARKAGSKFKKVGGAFPMLLWPTFERQSLASGNWAGGNDRQIRELEETFGNPLWF
jgi:hypothetical protein